MNENSKALSGLLKSLLICLILFTLFGIFEAIALTKIRLLVYSKNLLQISLPLTFVIALTVFFERGRFKKVHNSVDLTTSPMDGLVDIWQRQAEESDNRRKDAFKAHSNRLVPPITDVGKADVNVASNSELAIRHIFPPLRPQASLSFLGGSPIIPEDGSFDWPMVHNREGILEWLNFMAQIDCSQIPAGPARHLLPDSGYIYFFAPMSLNFGEDAHHFVARYLPGPISKNWRPCPIPHSSKIYDNSEQGNLLRGSEDSYPRVEIDLAWLEEPTDAEVETRKDEGLPYQVAEKIRAERKASFFGPKKDGVLYDGSDSSWLLDEDFPTNKAMARTLRDRMERHWLEQQESARGQLDSLEGTSENDPAFISMLTQKDALALYKEQIHKAFDGLDWNASNALPGLSNDEKERAKAFLSELLNTGLPWASGSQRKGGQDRQIIHRWMAHAAIIGARAALANGPGPDVASIPPPIIDALAARHDAREHRLFGNPTIIQDLDDMPERYILLLKLGNDREMDWLVGEMGPLQYWITPEDLAARRFENTVLTIEAH